MVEIKGVLECDLHVPDSRHHGVNRRQQERQLAADGQARQRDRHGSAASGSFPATSSGRVPSIQENH